MSNIGTGTAGTVLQGNGAGSSPKFSTATYPATAGTNGTLLQSNGTNIVNTTATYPGTATGTGTILRADGTNWSASTTTYPNTNAVSTLLYASSANVMSALTTANNGTLVTSATGVPSILAGPGSTGNILQSNAAAAPSFSSATYPSTAGTSGKVLISDGTNIVSSTPTFPNASATSGKFIRSDGTNWIASTPTLPTTAGTSSTLLRSDGTNFVNTTATYPATAGTSGTILRSDGTNIVNSTATYPATAGTTGTILRSDGTNLVNTTATYPATTTANRILYSSATNTISEITSAANSIVLTDASSVPSLGTSLSNDFTFTKATSGATTTLTVSNTSNTSSSAANILAQVAGATAADATHQSTISGGQNWTWGLDNSDSDAFVIAASSALGTTNVMRASTAGEINYPLQPAFQAVTSGAQNNVTGDATAYTVIFASEIFDQNNDFDGTSTFTAPVTGRYFLSATITTTGITDAAITAAQLNITTSNRGYIGWLTNTAAVKDAGNNLTVTCVALADMDAADTATVGITYSNGTKVVDVQVSGSNSRFQGYLAC